MSLYNYSPQKVIDLIDYNNSLYNVTTHIDKAQLNLVELSKYVQTIESNKGIDKNYNDMMTSLQDLYNSIVLLNNVLENVRENAVINRREEEEEAKRQEEERRRREQEQAQQSPSYAPSSYTSQEQTSSYKSC